MHTLESLAELAIRYTGIGDEFQLLAQTLPDSVTLLTLHGIQEAPPCFLQMPKLQQVDLKLFGSPAGTDLYLLPPSVSLLSLDKVRVQTHRLPPGLQQLTVNEADITICSALPLNEKQFFNFRGVPHLTSLTLTNVTIDSTGHEMGNLESLTNLQALCLEQVDVWAAIDLSLLTRLTLLRLNVEGAIQFDALPPSLQFLDLSYFDSVQLGHLTRLTRLTGLALSHLDDTLPDLGVLTQLLQLRLCDVELPDQPLLPRLSCLTMLELEQVHVRTAQMFPPHLMHLMLANGKFCIVEDSIPFLTHLTHLNLTNGGMFEVGILEPLTRLQNLTLDNFSLFVHADFSGMRCLTSLKLKHVQCNPRAPVAINTFPTSLRELYVDVLDALKCDALFPIFLGPGGLDLDRMPYLTYLKIKNALLSGDRFAPCRVDKYKITECEWAP